MRLIWSLEVLRMIVQLINMAPVHIVRDDESVVLPRVCEAVRVIIILRWCTDHEALGYKIIKHLNVVRQLSCTNFFYLQSRQPPHIPHLSKFQIEVLAFEGQIK